MIQIYTYQNTPNIMLSNDFQNSGSPNQSGKLQIHLLQHSP